MERTFGMVRTALVWIGRIEMVLAAAILVGIVGMIVGQVALDAGLGAPITWEQEAGAYGLVWLTFLGASVAMKQMRHVTIVSFVVLLPVRPRALIRATVYAIALWTLYAMMRELPAIMTIEARSRTVALPVSMPRSWFFSVPLWTACLLMAMTTALYLFEAVLTAIRPSPGGRDMLPVMDSAP